jgi:hypothetical protein
MNRKQNRCPTAPSLDEIARLAKETTDQTLFHRQLLGPQVPPLYPCELSFTSLQPEQFVQLVRLPTRTQNWLRV